jgi:O-antigen/teichoic acid export membrane protein
MSIPGIKGNGMAGLFSKAAQAVKFTTLSVSVQLVLRFVWVFAFARLLGPEGFGTAAAVFVVLEFARVFTETGLAEALIQRPDISRRERSTLFWVNLTVTSVIFFVLWGAAPTLASSMGLRQVGSLFPLAAFSILLGGSTAQFGAHLRKAMLFRELASITILSGVVGLLVALGLVVFAGFGPAGLVSGFVWEMGSRSYLLYREAKKQNILPAFEFCAADAKAFLSFGAFRGGGILADNLNTRLDQILIGYFLGLYPLGLYNLAANLTLTFGARLNSIITTVAFPVFSLVQTDTNKIKRGYVRVLKMIALFNIPVFIGVVVLAPDIVPAVFGKAWRDSVPIVQLLALVALSRSLINPAGSLIVAKGRAHWSLYWNGGILLFMPVLIGVPAVTGKLYAVAGTLACFYSLLPVFSHYLLVRPLLDNCGKEIGMAIAKPALSSGAVALVIFALRIFLAGVNPWITVISSMGIGAGLYFTLAFVFDRRFTSEMLKAAAS